MNTPSSINIALVDDDSLVVQLLREFLEQSTQPVFNIAITAHGGHEFIDKLSHNVTPIDILILDLKMEKGDGFYVLEQLTQIASEIKVIVLSSYYKASYIGQMMKLNTHAFLPKEIDKEDILIVIKEVLTKGYYLNAEQIERLRKQITPKSPRLHLTPKDMLTSRELEILSLIAKQKTTKEIAQELFVSPKTVEAHKSNLFSKTGVKNVAGLLMYAIQQQLIDPNDFMLLG